MKAGLRKAIAANLLAIVALGTLALAGCEAPAAEFIGIDLTGAEFARDFRLPDTKGVERTLADFRGSYLLVFFGYAQCPDVCPTALTRAVEVRKQLGDAGERVRVVFITVDPERDTAGVLDEYMAAFDPSFVALRGSLEQTEKTARDFRALYMKVPTGSSYAMDHTALTYVFDPAGKLRLGLAHASSAEQVVADLRLLMAGTRG
jgi:protein SCO1/2